MKNRFTPPRFAKALRAGKAGRFFFSALIFFTSFNIAFAQPDAKSKVLWEDEGIYRKQLKAEGIPPALIEKMVANKLELLASGRKVSSSIQNLKKSGQTPSPFANCSDMGGETGWGSWTRRNGDYIGGSITYGASGAPSAPRYNLTSGPGFDPCAPAAFNPNIPVVAPGFGSTSIQIGQPQTNGSLGGCSWGCAEELTYPLTVTANDTNFTFAYAIVMEDPSHGPTDQPYVSLCIYDSNGNSIGSCGCFKYISGPAIPGFYTSACNVNSVSYYKPWTLVGINLSAYIGQQLNVVIENVDCGQGGHFAQSYWDFSCGTLGSAYQFCIGEDSVLVTAPSNGSGYSYSWSTGQTTSSIIANPQLVDTLIVQIIPPSGCGFFNVISLLPTTINTALSYTINCNQVTFSDSTTITGGTITNWQWAFPGGSTPSFNGQTPPVITYSPGTYTASLTVTSQAGCTDTTAYVSFTIGPPPSITVNSVAICANMTDTLCASSGFSSYVWNPSGQNTSCIIVSTSSASSYTVTGTDANGCTATAVATVNTNAQPAITAVGDQVCANGIANLTGSGGVSYVWSPPTGLSCISCANPSAGPIASTTTYTVVGTDVNGCTNTDTALISILPNPNVSGTTTPAGCTVNSGTATANGSGGSSPYSYVWSTAPAQSSQTATGLTANQQYVVQITDANGCTNTTTVTVGITPNPTAIACCPTTICPGQTTTVLNASSVPQGVSYVWTPATGLSNPNISNPIANPSFSNTYSVTVTDANGCTDVASVAITVGSIPFISAIAPSTICNGDSATLYSNVSNGNLPYTYYWSPPNDLNNPTLQNPTSGAANSTPYTVTVTDANGCTDDTTTFLSVETVPSVTWASWTPDLTCDGYIIPLKANVSSNGQQVIWNFGDGSAPLVTYAPNTDAGPHAYPFNGTYTLTVVVFNVMCTDTVDTTLVISDMSGFLSLMPANVFTPNGDGMNDCFHPAFIPAPNSNISPDTLESLQECLEMEVWDRWGIKMFESAPGKKCWDGKTKNGKDAKDGTYYYIATFGEIKLPGYVTLLREK